MAKGREFVAGNGRRDSERDGGWWWWQQADGLVSGGGRVEMQRRGSYRQLVIQPKLACFGVSRERCLGRTRCGAE